MESTDRKLENPANTRERTVVFNGSLLDEKTLEELRKSWEHLEASKTYDRMIVGPPIPKE